MLTRLLLVLMLILTGAGAVSSAEPPVLPKARGEACIDQPPVMRRFHMEMLKHQRDDTVRHGIRGAKASLKDCVSCHAATGADGKTVPVNAPGQFCQSCHEYVAAKPDCFECHSPLPHSQQEARR